MSSEREPKQARLGFRFVLSSKEKARQKYGARAQYFEIYINSYFRILIKV